jgi:uncharacterized membrane protein
MSGLPGSAPSRFDAILLVMGLVLAAAVVVTVTSGVSMRVAGSGAALVAGAAMLDGLVWHPPVE